MIIGERAHLLLTFPKEIPLKGGFFCWHVPCFGRVVMSAITNEPRLQSQSSQSTGSFSSGVTRHASAQNASYSPGAFAAGSDPIPSAEGQHVSLLGQQHPQVTNDPQSCMSLFGYLTDCSSVGASGQAAAAMHRDESDKAPKTSPQSAHAGGGAKASQLDVSSPATAFEKAISSSAGELPYRAQLEQAFGVGLSDVRAYLGGAAAREGLSRLDAHAAAQGQHVVFAESSPSLGLVAHETAHVIQQRGGGGIQCKAVGVSAPGGDAEARADAAAEAVVAGQPVPDVGTAPGDHIYRVETSGGKWTTPVYTAQPTGSGVVGDRVGCSIELHFTPNDLVEAPASSIGITQSVKSMKSVTSGGPRNTFAPPSDPGKVKVTLDATSGDPGRGIDRMVYPPDATGPAGARAIPNTNPMYGVYNPGVGVGGVSKSLNDNTPSVGQTQFGSHVKKSNGTFAPAVDAVLTDSPSRILESNGQTFEQTFESTALVMSGPLANTYLGSVAWGYTSTADGRSELTPQPISVVSQGNPSALFNEAAAKWNKAMLPDRSDPTGATTIDTVDLPIDNARHLSQMAIKEILVALSTIDTEISHLSGAEAAKKALLKRGLENEARGRSLKVSVKVKTTEDWTGADDVYVKLKNEHGGESSSGRKALNDGDSHVFRVALGRALPHPGGALSIEIFDGDEPDSDDLLVTMCMPSPYAPVVNTSTMDGANYAVRAYFD